jgi:hypothetical protein
VKVVLAARHHPGELAPLRLAPHGADECQPPDLGVGHAGVGEGVDVGGDPIELLEGAPPGDRAGAPGTDQGAVDVEEDRLDVVPAGQAQLRARAAR